MDVLTRAGGELALPCVDGDPDWWFAENRGARERAKVLCAGCPIRRECLAAALERQEPCGVWGGELIERGAIVACKRPRGRPRKDSDMSHMEVPVPLSFDS